MVQSLFVLWGIFLPLTWWIVIHRDGDAHAAWLGGAALYLLQAAGLWWRVRSGKWKRVRIFAAREAVNSPGR
ncbi:MAG: hypothetical protein ACYDIE_11245 [Candidatus Krumholzibacteriia bacterium]